VADARDALLIIAAAHGLEVDATLRGRFLSDAYVPTGRSKVRGRLVRLAPTPRLDGEHGPPEYQVATEERTWSFFPNDVLDLRVVWVSASERDRLPAEEGRISLRCPSCACIATYAGHEPTVRCVNCNKRLRVPEHPH
jgi:hypothetical protein